MKKYILILTTVLCFNAMYSQVLFSEDFDSYPAGHLNTDYTNTTSGQGGWLVSKNIINSTATAMVTAEAGKGNVLMITSNTPVLDGVNFRQDHGVIAALWNNRTSGNNILKFEYEFYGTGVSIAYGSISSTVDLINLAFRSSLNLINGYYFDTTSVTNIILKDNTNPFPYNTWIKAEVFIDYNTNNVYFYLPTLNLQSTAPFSHNKAPEDIVIGATLHSSTSVVKFDNIKISALQARPPYLSVNDFVSSKFNVFPNPATNVITITNAENIGIEQIEVFDVNGKMVKSQNCKNENEVQLNVENLVSGTYMLHIKTNEGVAVKKVVKK